MTKLKISFTRDYSDNFLFDIDTLDFQRAASAIFAGTQFGGNQLDDHLQVDGSAGANRIIVNTSIRGLDAHGWSFSDWQSADRLVINGSLWSERLIGTSRRDDIFGNDGRDTVKAGAGDDLVSGGAGQDWLAGASGNDTLSYEGSAAGVAVNLTSGETGGGDAFGDRISGFENLTGSSSSDKLWGNSGANRITGGLGADLVKGRGGADRFVFSDPADSTGSGMDVIGDFSRAQGDLISLANIDAIAGGRDDSFRFIGERAFHHAGDLRIARFGSQTLVQGDINGDGFADFEFMIDRNIKLIESDFIL